MPNESGLTPLADYSRQPLELGTPPLYIFGADKRPVQKEMLELSLQLRLVAALEAPRPLATAPMLIQASNADTFRDMVGDWSGTGTPLAIVSWELLSSGGLLVTLAYQDASALIDLGRRWELMSMEGWEPRLVTKTLEPAEVLIAIATTMFPRFQEWVAKQKEVVLVSHYASDLLNGYHTMVVLRAEESWRFFGVGMDWATYLQEGNKDNA